MFSLQRAEMVRQKLEKVDVSGDMQTFISTCGTGTERPGMTLHTYYMHLYVYLDWLIIMMMIVVIITSIISSSIINDIFSICWFTVRLQYKSQ